MTTSTLSWRSSWVANCRPLRTARRAASLTILASSAPEAPAAVLAMGSKFTSSAKRIFFAWTFRISIRPWRSGSSTGMRRSNRPGRSRAGSRLPLVVTADLPVALLADGVDLIDEHDAWSLLVGLLEQVADLGGPAAHEHLYKL